MRINYPITNKDYCDYKVEGRVNSYPLPEEFTKILNKQNFDYPTSKLTQVDSFGRTALHMAILASSRKMLDQLIQKGIDLNARTRPTQSEMFRVREGNHYDGHYYTEYLLEEWEGLDNVGQHTPLYLALMDTSNIELAKTLVAAGADANIATQSGQTPLLLCASLNHDAGSELLISNGADVNYASPEGTTALHIACREKNLKQIDMLLSAGAAINQSDSNRINALNFIFVDPRGDNQPKDPETKFKLADKLLLLGLQNREVPPTHTVSTKHGEEKVFRYLIAKGFSLDEHDFEGHTPLWCALLYHRVSRAQLLMKLGADFFAPPPPNCSYSSIEEVLIAKNMPHWLEKLRAQKP